MHLLSPLRSCLPILATLLGGALAAEESHTVVTDTGTVISSSPGGTVKVVSHSDGTSTVITTTTTSETTLGPAVVVGTGARATSASSRWDLDIFSGARFGGIIGASIDNTLCYDTHAAIEPELSADVGVGGTTLGLGARWSLSKKQWTLSSQGLSVDYDSTTAVILRAIAPYRWETRHRHPSFWHGVVTDGGWYYGGEVDVLFDNIALAVQATWEAERHVHAPRFTLAYGYGF